MTRKQGGRGGATGLATRLDRLIRAVSPQDRECSYREISRMIEARSGEVISASYIQQLRTGVKDNPTMRHLELLADFFGVPPAYFFEDATASAVEAELELLVALRDSEVRGIAMRSVGLSPEGMRLVADVIERTRALDGLDRPAGRGRARRAATADGVGARGVGARGVRAGGDAADGSPDGSPDGPEAAASRRSFRPRKPSADRDKRV